MLVMSELYFQFLMYPTIHLKMCGMLLLSHQLNAEQPWFLWAYGGKARCGESPPPSHLGGIRRRISPKQGERLVA